MIRNAYASQDFLENCVKTENVIWIVALTESASTSSANVIKGGVANHATSKIARMTAITMACVKMDSVFVRRTLLDPLAMKKFALITVLATESVLMINNANVMKTTKDTIALLKNARIIATTKVIALKETVTVKMDSPDPIAITKPVQTPVTITENVFWENASATKDLKRQIAVLKFVSQIVRDRGHATKTSNAIVIRDSKEKYAT